METRMSGEAVEEELQCLEGVCGMCGVRVCGWIWMWMWDVPVEIPICGWSLKLLFSGDVAGLKPDPSHPSGALILSSASSFLFSPRPVLLVLFSSPFQMSQSYIPHSRTLDVDFVPSSTVRILLPKSALTYWIYPGQREKKSIIVYPGVLALVSLPANFRFSVHPFLHGTAVPQRRKRNITQGRAILGETGQVREIRRSRH